MKQPNVTTATPLRLLNLGQSVLWFILFGMTATIVSAGATGSLWWRSHRPSVRTILHEIPMHIIVDLYYMYIHILT